MNEVVKNPGFLYFIYFRIIRCIPENVSPDFVRNFYRLSISTYFDDKQSTIIASWAVSIVI